LTSGAAARHGRRAREETWGAVAAACQEFNLPNRKVLESEVGLELQDSLGHRIEVGYFDMLESARETVLKAMLALAAAAGISAPERVDDLAG
jgi:hypothetical protein